MAKARIAESTLTSEGSASLSTVSCTLRHRDGVGPASHVQAERPVGATCASRPLSLDVTRHRLAPTLAKPPMVQLACPDLNHGLDSHSDSCMLLTCHCSIRMLSLHAMHCYEYSLTRRERVYFGWKHYQMEHGPCQPCLFNTTIF
jgi:hypothetical protein